MAEEFKPTAHNVLLWEECGCGSVLSPKNNCNYYTSMNEEERNEKLKSLISYCRDSMDLQVHGI